MIHVSFVVVAHIELISDPRIEGLMKYCASIQPFVRSFPLEQLPEIPHFCKKLEYNLI